MAIVHFFGTSIQRICFKIGQFEHWLLLLPLLYIQIFGVFAFFFVRFFLCVCLQPHSFIKRISTNKRRKKTHMERKQEALLSISAVINIFRGNQFCQLLIKLSMITAVSWIHLSHLFFCWVFVFSKLEFDSHNSSKAIFIASVGK